MNMKASPSKFSETVFSRLDNRLQEFVYGQGWTALHEIQGQAIEAILDTINHILISSGTASGKTEAAFLPILTTLLKEPCETAGVLYIGPLKALINDQFSRLDSLLSDVGIPVWRWHGDVDAGQKKRFWRSPSGILQITPESLEAMLIKRRGDLPRLFHGLRFVVIDEIHAFLGTDRGAQLLCLLTKLERFASCRPRRIGLSATLGDSKAAEEYLSAGTNVPVSTISDGKLLRTVRIGADYFTVFSDPETGEVKKEDPDAKAYTDALYQNCRGKKAILFADSRAQAEDATTSLRCTARGRGEPDIFRVHHGSIAGELRGETERLMRESKGPLVTCATLTLELGIDVGDLDRVIQLGAPRSCQSFLQRLGRSGRRTGVSQMYFTFLQMLPEEPDLPEELPFELLRMIAVIELYRDERFIEPPPPKPFPASLLFHQTLSMLACLGELSPSELARNVLTLPPFQRVSKERFRELLLSMCERGFLQKTEEGGLLIGLNAEELVNSYRFYAVFPEEESFTVVWDGKEIGSVNKMPVVQMHIALAGRSWKVVNLDLSGKRVFVVPGRKRAKKLWAGYSGDIHLRVARRMRQLLFEKTEYPYLFQSAKEGLLKARGTAEKHGLPEHMLFPAKEGGYWLLPFLGSREARTLEAALTVPAVRQALKLDGVRMESELCFHLDSGLSLHELEDNLCKAIGEVLDIRGIVSDEKLPLIDKYDQKLPLSLRRAAYEENHLDLLALKLALGIV